MCSDLADAAITNQRRPVDQAVFTKLLADTVQLAVGYLFAEPRRVGSLRGPGHAAFIERAENLAAKLCVRDGE
jgi:hypothetical protein